MSSSPGDPEGDVQRPVQQTVCGAVLRGSNWKCLILTLLIYGCLGAVTWCRLAEGSMVSTSSTMPHPSMCSPVCPPVLINLSGMPLPSSKSSPCGDTGYVYIPVAFVLMLYLVYLVECWHCTIREELSTTVHVASVLESVRAMREARPLVWWKATCYHYVRRKRQVVRTRSGGEAYTTTHVYYERVDSHAAGACFVFAYCGVRDASRELCLESRRPITKIRFSKGFAFANVEAAADFEEQRVRFFAEHERYDDYMEMREGLDLAGVTNFKEHVVAHAGLPWYASRFAFWLCSALLLSWPIRVLLEYNTAHVHYQVTKLFGVNYLSGSTTADSIADSVFYPGPLAPSYSEAILMPHDNNNTVSVSLTPLAPPPAYEDALRLPVLTRLRRSLTDRGEDLFRRERRRSSGVVVRVNMETSL